MIMKQSFPITCVWIVSLFLSSCTPEQLFVPTTTPTRVTQTFKINVPANALWFDTSIKIAKGQNVAIWATGNLNPWARTKQSNTKVSGQTTFFCDDSPCHLPRAYHGELLGRLERGIPFRIYTAFYFTAPSSGELFLGFKDWSIEDSLGEFIVTVTLSSQSSW